MKVIDGGITAVTGFEAAGIEAAVKYQNRKDMAIIYSTVPFKVAGTFTTNVVKAAPVLWDKDIVDNSPFAQAVIVNTGIANAGTGKEGMSYCEQEAKKASELLGIPQNAVLVGSTGVIGKHLPMDRICNGIEKLVVAKNGSIDAGHDAAKAIMTTDTCPKEIAVELELGGKKVVVGGMSKGSGMIHPNMATMLGFVTTDIDIEDGLLKKALKETVNDTFNMISVDGDTSTNDSVLLLANGMSGNAKITKENDNYLKFKEALMYVNRELAKKIAGDGEGATCLFEVQVVGAESKEQAVTLSKSIVTSSLTKAAIFGHDANWGRILCAMGYSGAQFDPEKVDIYFESENGKLKIVEDGTSTGYSEEEATKILSSEHVKAIADVKMGNYEATAYGCDLTFDYVKINADYRS